MIIIFLTLQILVCIFMVGVILLQKEANTGLEGLSGSTSIKSPSRAAETLLTKLTKYLACIFIINSLILANLVTRQNKASSIIEKLEHREPTVPTSE